MGFVGEWAQVKTSLFWRMLGSLDLKNYRINVSINIGGLTKVSDFINADTNEWKV